MTVLIIGLCMTAGGIAGGLHLLFSGFGEGGPGWLHAIAAGLSYLLIPGLIVALIGLGMWLAHPHVIHF